MNKINYQQVGGFPLETDTLDFAQSAAALLQNLSALAGDNYILSGCTVNGQNVSSGVMVLSGELLPFEGGLLQSKVIVRETKQTRPFENGAVKDVFITRVAVFGTGAESYTFADLARPMNLQTVTTQLPEKAPLSTLQALIERVDRLDRINAVFTNGGGMVLWNKPYNEIPEGWAEVVDWRKRLPMGYDPNDPAYAIGESGGRDNVTLDIVNIPPHKHTTTFTKGKADGSSRQYLMAAPNDPAGTYSYESGSAGGIGGSAQPFSILNRFRIVVFIEYVGG